MSSAASDRNLLFGVLALQMDFVPRDALLAAMNAWVLDKARPLGEILVAQGALQAAKRNLLDSLVDAHLEMHGHDADKSLAAVPLSTPLRRELQGLADPDVQAGLSRMPTPTGEGEPGLLTTTTAEIHREGGLRYHVLRSHDKGGIGEVFVALDQELNREVALKEMQEQHADDAPSRGRFVREAEITGGLEHPGIVPVYGLGQYGDGRPYYAMRFIRGETLKDAIGKYHAGQAEWTLRALLMRFVTVCNTLAYAHSRGVIHRDVKPANIMLGQYGETLVVDWGMAKAVTEPVDAASRAASGSARLAEPTLIPRLADSVETLAGSALGTPAYMSPEQATGRLDLLGPASDIYSLGATLYTLLTGRPPIEGKDTAEVLRKAQKGEWLPVRQVKPDVPPALAAICQTAMALEPSARYSSALELAADVEHWLADEPVAAYRESWLERSRRWRRRHRTLVSTAGGVLVVALAGMAVGLVIVSEAKQQEANARRTAEDNEKDARKQKEEAQKQKKEADLRREEARFNQYVAQMNLVQREYEANNIGHVRELLAAQVPKAQDEKDLRNFEWHYWQRMANRELLILKKVYQIPVGPGVVEDVSFGVMGVSFSSDGERLTSVGRDGAVHVWDTAIGQEVLNLPANHTNLISSTAFSKDGQHLALASDNGTVRVRDTATGKELFSLKGDARAVWGVSYSPDGRLLASAGNDGMVRIRDAATGKELTNLKGHSYRVLCVCFSPDGRRLASAGWDQTIRVWDTANGKELLTLRGHSSQINSLSFSLDGSRLASASDDQTVRVWDAATGQERLTLKGHSFSVRGVLFSPDSKRLASVSLDQTVRIWDSATGRELLILRGHTSEVKNVSFSTDGRRLASGSEDGTVRVWDAATGLELLTLTGHMSMVNGISFSHDGRLLASASEDKTVRVWETATGKELLTFKGHEGGVKRVSFNPDGRRLASCGWDQKVRVWEFATGKELLTFKGPPQRSYDDVSFSPDGQRLVSANGDGKVRIWDATHGDELLTLKTSGGSVHCACFSPDGRRIASRSGAWMVQLWDAYTGKEQRTLTVKQNSNFFMLGRVSFDPKGYRVASGAGQTARVWDATTGKELLNIKGHLGQIRSVSFSPDGRRLASASDDHTVRIWDTDTGRELLILKGHSDRVLDVSFSPDGRRLASASADGTIRVWEALDVPQAIWRQRGLVRKVDDLFEKLLLREDVLAALHNDPTLDEADRKFAIEVAQSQSLSVNPRSWNEAAWNVVKLRDAGKDAYLRAHSLADTAARLSPGDGNVLNTLGVSLYRVGRYVDALSTLTKSEKLNASKEGSLPSDLAFLAMTQHQLSKKSEAKATLDRLREVMKLPRWAKDGEAAGFLREAEELIEGGASGEGGLAPPGTDWQEVLCGGRLCGKLASRFFQRANSLRRRTWIRRVTCQALASHFRLASHSRSLSPFGKGRTNGPYRIGSGGPDRASIGHTRVSRPS